MRVIPLGGSDGFGRSCTAYTSPQVTALIDCGAQLPDDRTPGIDRFLPRWDGLRGRTPPVRALFLTHGHEDHCAAAPALLVDREICGDITDETSPPLPVFATPFTLRLLALHCDAHGVPRERRSFHALAPGQTIKIDDLSVTAVGVPHSIPASLSLLVTSDEPGGPRTAWHSGDYKLDGHRDALAALPRGVDLLIGDSTNATRPGRSGDEAGVAASLAARLAATPGRLVVALFSSHVERIGAFAAACQRSGRRLLVLGAKLREVIAAAEATGIIVLPASLRVEESAAARLPPRELAILCTGSQGEPEAALARLSHGEPLRLGPGDAVVLSARVIPGSERPILRLCDRLLRRGVAVLSGAPFSVSGHGCQDELDEVLAQVQPRALLPVHGSQAQLRAYAALAAAQGIPALLCQDGDVVEVGEAISIVDRLPAGRQARAGHTVGAVGDEALGQRLRLAQTGLVFVSGTGPLRVDAVGVIDDGPLLRDLCARAAAAGTSARAAAPDPTAATEAVRRAVRRVFSDALGFRPTVQVGVIGA